MSIDQDCAEAWLVLGLWLEVSHEVAVKMLARAMAIGRLGWARRIVSRVAHSHTGELLPVVGRKPPFLPT